jgi:hypothetical protein
MNRPVCFLMLVALLAPSCTRPQMARAPDSTTPVPGTGATPSKLPGLDARSTVPPRRRVIRDADLAVEADDPARAQQQAIAVVERLGGFASSTGTLSGGLGPGRGEIHINLVLRVPAEKFAPALGELRSLGRGTGREQLTGQDVSEEYVDLEARVRTERALEAQLLEILRSTKAVSEMMEVHTRLAEVRSEIEKMEGRLRFLDDQTSLSTIRLEILGPAPRGIGDSVRRATDDLVAVASGIVTGGIRLAGVLLPVLVMIVLPAYAIVRAVLRRRASRAR